jgi:L-lactate dehydrogenase complex protein LldG
VSAARDTVLARVRAALGRGESSGAPPPASAPAVDEAVARICPRDADLPAVFAARASRVGLKVQRTSAGALPDAIAAIIRGAGAATVTVDCVHDRLAGAIEAACHSAGAAIVPPTDEPGAGCFQAGAGITDVLAAVAETGSLVVCADDRHRRSTYMVPPVHIALVPASRIVPDLIDLFAATGRLCSAGFPSALVLISGPSKTADIEGVLVMGVHGPRDVHAVVIDDL